MEHESERRRRGIGRDRSLSHYSYWQIFGESDIRRYCACFRWRQLGRRDSYVCLSICLSVCRPMSVCLTSMTVLLIPSRQRSPRLSDRYWFHQDNVLIYLSFCLWKSIFLYVSVVSLLSLSLSLKRISVVICVLSLSCLSACLYFCLRYLNAFGSSPSHFLLLCFLVHVLHVSIRLPVSLSASIPLCTAYFATTTNVYCMLMRYPLSAFSSICISPLVSVAV